MTIPMCETYNYYPHKFYKYLITKKRKCEKQKFKKKLNCLYVKTLCCNLWTRCTQEHGQIRYELEKLLV